MVKIFIENAESSSLDLWTKDNHGLAGFHWACRKGHSDVVNIFMENASAFNIDLNRKDNDGLTGFHWVCQSKPRRARRDLVKTFMENASALSIDLNTVMTAKQVFIGHVRKAIQMWLRF